MMGLAQIGFGAKQTAVANIDFTDAVPNDCKFRVSASYNNPDDF